MAIKFRNNFDSWHGYTFSAAMTNEVIPVGVLPANRTATSSPSINMAKRFASFDEDDINEKRAKLTPDSTQVI